MNINRMAAAICLMIIVVTSHAGILTGDRSTSQVFGTAVPANQTQLTIKTKWNVTGSRCKNS